MTSVFDLKVKNFTFSKQKRSQIQGFVWRITCITYSSFNLYFSYLDNSFLSHSLSGFCVKNINYRHSPNLENREQIF